MRLNQKFKHFLLFTAGAAIIGCSSDSDEVLGTPDDGGSVTEQGTIRITQGGNDDDKFTAEVTGQVASTTQGRVILKGTDNKQRRLYVTREVPGEPAEPYIIPELDKKSTKADGSIDLDGETKNELDFTFDLDVPTTTNGSIVYRFWTTSGRGDFREPSKRLVAGIGTITVKVGSGVNPDADIESGTAVLLAAPLANGNSNTFVSFLDLSRTYKINEGAGFAALWDFGYYYGNEGKASLASSNDYPSNIVDIVAVANTKIETGDAAIVKADLRKVYFKKGSTLNFDDITMAKDLDAVTVTKTNAQRVTQLAVGDLVEFIDQNDKKGILKVEALTTGAGTAGKITLNIKVQP